MVQWLGGTVAMWYHNYRHGGEVVQWLGGTVARGHFGYAVQFVGL